MADCGCVELRALLWTASLDDTSEGIGHCVRCGTQTRKALADMPIGAAVSIATGTSGVVIGPGTMRERMEHEVQE